MMKTFSHIIRIQLIEEVPISDAGLRCLLEKESDFKLMKHIRCKLECHLICANPAPDVLLMVMGVGTQSGLECIQQIIDRHSDTKILVLCMTEDVLIARHLLELGVKGIVCSRTPPKILFRAIRKIAHGESYIDTDIARMIVIPSVNNETSPFSSLSRREYEIVKLMLNGLNQQKIGIKLFISPHTVANHHAHIMTKLHIGNHIELTKMAIRHGLTTA